MSIQISPETPHPFARIVWGQSCLAKLKTSALLLSIRSFEYAMTSNAQRFRQNLIFETLARHAKQSNILKHLDNSCYIFALNSNASYYMTRLLSWKMLCPKWIALLIIAHFVVIITFVVVTCVIRFPKFAMSISNLLIKSKEKHLSYNYFRSVIRQRFLRILYNLSKVVFASLYDDR